MIKGNRECDTDAQIYLFLAWIFTSPGLLIFATGTLNMHAALLIPFPYPIEMSMIVRALVKGLHLFSYKSSLLHYAKFIRTSVMKLLLAHLKGGGVKAFEFITIMWFSMNHHRCLIQSLAKSRP